MRTVNEEARAKWGDTKAYREYEQKAAVGTDFDAAGRKMMEIFAELGQLRHLEPGVSEVQNKVEVLRNFITENFYTCTKEILAGLGQMYTGDERFRKNIDRAGGEGTAEFAAKAIEIYCAGE